MTNTKSYKKQKRYRYTKKVDVNGIFSAKYILIF